MGNVIGERPGADSNSVILACRASGHRFSGRHATFASNETATASKLLESPTTAPALRRSLALRARFPNRAFAPRRQSCSRATLAKKEKEICAGFARWSKRYGKRLAAVIAVDGPSADHVTTQAVASRRFEVSVTGPGGHSWSDFGAPNPITAISRGIVRFSSIRVPTSPRSSYNFGAIEGGTSVNSIPARASVKVDLRSEDESRTRPDGKISA